MSGAAKSKTPSANGTGAKGPDLRSESPLASKLMLARKAAKAVEKTGTNQKHNYKYAKAEDVMKEAERVLQEQGILVIPSVVDVSETFGNGLMLQVRLEYEVIDSETEESMKKPWISYGYDKPGDKAIFKAITGGEKYFLARLLGIPFGTDPDGDEASEAAPARAQANRREGQSDGRSAQASAPQRRKIHALASELGLTAPQLKAWIEWSAGTPHTDRIEKKRASELIEMLEGYDDAADALTGFNAALEAGDEKAEQIATKHSGSQG